MTTDYERIEKALEYVSRHRVRQPALEEVAAAIHLSPFHFQRLFKRWAGISPKRFLQFVTVEHAKKLLKESKGVLETSLEAGLSGPGRLHDLFVSLEAVTPGEFKQKGQGLDIAYAFCSSPFGKCLIAITHRGVCQLSFICQQDYQPRLARLRTNWPLARLVQDPEAVAPVAKRIFEHAPAKRESRIGIHVRGTNFQIKVWKALLGIPRGCLCAYQDVAVKVGHPEAVRAVGNAIGANPVSYLIPCHRVVRKFGGWGGYDGGLLRKRALIGWEASQKGVAV